jgi:hypothetical protein
MKVDFCVIGGGLAGVCAAIAAARNGAKVVLVQDRSVLGGNASSEIKMHVVGADCHGHRPGARETGILEELRLEDAYRNPHRSYPLWDLLLYEKVIAEPNITLLLDTACDGCETETVDGGKRIVAAKLTRHITEDQFLVRARFFADCSGDGRLGAEAGADFMSGRESLADFGETFAMAEADGQTLGNSILFTARKYDTPQPFVRPNWVRQFTKEQFKFRPIHGYEYGYWWSEWGGNLSTIKDFDVIRRECLRIALGVWDYIKNSGDYPDSENWALEWVGPIPGKRESRRFLGPKVLVQDDVMLGRTFDDQVAYGGWWLDLHPPTGIDAIEEQPCVQHHTPHLYGIPLGILHSRNIANLFMAGRNVSATHVAFASTRVMGTCAVMGQAIGTAAAILGDQNQSTIASTPSLIQSIQQRLLRDNAYLPGVANRDPHDLARTARVTASSENPDAPAANVVNGFNRTVSAGWGPWADERANHWESTSLPATLHLEWPAAKKVRSIHLTFDSGLQRELTLTPSDHITKKLVRGAQPELVKDYRIYADGQLVLSVEDNYLRHRVHHFPALECARISIEVRVTRGVTTARVYEVRCYGE